MTTLLETCAISPSPVEAAAEVTVPLAFFDILWIHAHPPCVLFFYEYSQSQAYFLDTIIPKLKESLSLILKHYLPIAGNIIYPLNTEKKPVFRFLAGDSVSMTIAESSNDFENLTGDHARDADSFYDYVPQMPPVKDEPECQIVPILAVQVTLFPGRGICIGVTNNHSIGDGSSIVRFIRAWGSMNRLGSEDEFLIENSESLPVFDRSVIKDPLGIDTIFWKVKGEMPFKSSSFPLPTNRVRATYTFSQADIRRLKDFVLAKRPHLVQLSSFVVTTSYVWSCLVKSGDSAGEEVDENVPEFFAFPVDARARINPPVPANYFGNCLSMGVGKIGHQELAGDEGFVNAVETVAEQIKNKVNNKDELLKGVENWLSDTNKSVEIRSLAVFGSPKFNQSNADFGWGKTRKVEVVSIDGDTYSMSLCESRDAEGGLEVGLSLTKARMEAFASIFSSGLKFL